MKKHLFILSFIFPIQKTQSQIVFCPPGAEWHYSFYVGFPYTIYNAKIKYVKDSIVGADTLKVLSHIVYYHICNGGPIQGGAVTFIKQKGDTVFMKSASTRNTWQILNNYAATAGQSWTTSISPYYNFSVTATYTITVDSINTITINNFVLKQLFVKYKHSGNQFTENTVITERLGCGMYMFNYYNPSLLSECDGSQYFLCYQDSVFGLKQFTDKPCDYQDYVGIAENYQNSNIKIYPNPVTDIFTISSDDVLENPSTFLSIKDLCGREIKNLAINNLNSGPTKVDIFDLPKGLYILNLSNHKQVIYTGKLIKDQ